MISSDKASTENQSGGTYIEIFKGYKEYVLGRDSRIENDYVIQTVLIGVSIIKGTDGG